MKKISFLLLCLLLMGGYVSSAGGFSFTSTPAFMAASAPDRALVIISDLHLGAGKNSGQSWYTTEDFRWPKALKAFLDEMSRRGNDRVDLIIAGDLLDMWQPPENIRCKGDSSDPNLGCTVEEMTAIASWIVKAHKEEFEHLRLFSQKGENRLHILPGNHDAALLIAPVWEPVGKALKAEKGRVNFVVTGVWRSVDYGIVVEHGHQIGNDANRYKRWPDIVRVDGNKEYIERSWGEQFIQQVFTQHEYDNQIIDNFSPESLGAWYWKDKRGLWGTAADMAKLVAFNLSQTSFSQKVQFLGDKKSPEEKPKWNIPEARKLGHGLFVAAMPQDDAGRARLLEETEEAKEVRQELDRLALDTEKLPDGTVEMKLPDENVQMLCDQAATRGNSVCDRPHLGYAIEKLLVPKERVLVSHLIKRQGEFPKMHYFVYGHTHDLAIRWKPEGISYVQAMNSGAFYRVIGENGFLSRVRQKGISPGQGLEKISLDELPPCYTFVKKIPPEKEPQVFRWVMKESDANGQIVNPEDAICE